MQKTNILMLCLLLLTAFTACKKDDNKISSGAARIDSFTPAAGGGTTEVLITGENFTADTSKLSVSINGKLLKIIGANDHQIMAVVPKKVGTGPLVVTVNGQAVTSAAPFTYQYTRSVTTLAGNGAPGYANGTGTDAQFHFFDGGNAWYRSMGIVTDKAGNVYVADCGNHCIRKIDASGNVTLFAGTGEKPGYADGARGIALFSLPYGLAIDSADNIYCVDPGNYDIRKITPDGNATTIGWGANSPWGIAVNKSTGEIYYSCTDNGVVYQLNSNGSSTKIAEGLFYPAGIVCDKAGNIYVASNGDHTIVKLAVGTWTASIIAGTAGSAGFSDGQGAAARFSSPWGLGIDNQDNIYVAGNGTWDGGTANADQSIRMITAGTWNVHAFAGSGTAGYTNAIGAAASFSAPGGVAADKNGVVYVLDKRNNAVRKIISE